MAIPEGQVNIRLNILYYLLPSSVLYHSRSAIRVALPALVLAVTVTL